MADEDIFLARGQSDALDRLTSADALLAGLHQRCGGERGGTIAIPELLELVRKARQYRFRLARTIAAQDGGETVTAWVEAEPDPMGEGCQIRVRTWNSAPLAGDEALQNDQRRLVVDRHLAELSARLDARQNVLTVTAQPGELAALGAAMAAGVGQAWTNFLPPDKGAHRQPLHWRLLDGVEVAIKGSNRPWRVSLIPHAPAGGEPQGFELLLVSDEPSPLSPMPCEEPDPFLGGRLVGQDLAPVLRPAIARIIANSETIRTRLAGPLADAYAEYAGEIAGAGKLLIELVEDLADLEMVEGDDFTTQPDSIDLVELVRQASGILGVRAREKAIRIELPDSEEALPAVAEFRRALQVLLNLIGNAIRYSPREARIWFRFERTSKHARVAVIDEGPGIAPENHEAVFEKFERLGRAGDGGSGLGLYISRRLARAMGGELTVESAPGGGAQFLFEVPFNPEG